MHRRSLSHHTRKAVAALTGAGLMAAAATSVPVQAQSQRAYYNQIGNWVIYAERNNRGVLTRCYADLTSSSGLLRFAWFSSSREYWMSWTSPQTQPGRTLVTLHFDRGYRASATVDRGSRTAIKLNPQMVDNLLRANETISIDQDGEWMSWSLNRESMENVFMSVENCVNDP